LGKITRKLGKNSAGDADKNAPAAVHGKPTAESTTTTATTTTATTATTIGQAAPPQAPASAPPGLTQKAYKETPRNLWNEAYIALRKRDQSLVNEYVKFLLRRGEDSYQGRYSASIICLPFSYNQ
jgi:hypothetical protein